VRDSKLHKSNIRHREAFNDVAELYAAARPGYPEALLEDLITLSHNEHIQRILEIGPGTGQITLPLAQSGFSLVAVELGPRLAKLLKTRLEQFSNVFVVVADFDEWSTDLEPFDLVLAATAFHWLDPKTRVSKCARLLRPGGALAIIETYWGVGSSDDSFARESQTCYARWDPYHDPDYQPRGTRDLPEKNDELENSGLFAEVIHKRYLCERIYSADEYCDLLGTFSNVLAWNDQERDGFLNCIRGLICSRFGGKVMRHDVHDLSFAKTVEAVA
jgi:SAM-dependent methyltransferase